LPYSRVTVSGSIYSTTRRQRQVSLLGRFQRFALRFLRPLSIKKSSSFLPRLIAATSQRGFAPRPAQVSPGRLRYFGGTFLPFIPLPPPRTTLAPPTTSILSNCC